MYVRRAEIQALEAGFAKCGASFCKIYFDNRYIKSAVPPFITNSKFILSDWQYPVLHILAVPSTSHCIGSTHYFPLASSTCLNLGMSGVVAFVELSEASSPFTFLTFNNYDLWGRIKLVTLTVLRLKSTHLFLLDPQGLAGGDVRLSCRSF